MGHRGPLAVTLYRPDIQSAAPILLPGRRIASIDGGCVLKKDGQLNALILPEEGSQRFTWTAWDGLPTATALDGQQPSRRPLNIRWGRSAVEVLEEGRSCPCAAILETGRRCTS